MESTKLWVVMLVLITIFASSAFAVNVANTDINVDYDQLRKNDDKITVSHSVSIVNTGSSEETLNFVLVNAYGLTLDVSSAVVAAGGSTSVVINGELPVTFDGGSNSIATLKVTDSSGETSHTIKALVENMIEIDKIRVLVNGNEEKIANEDDEQVKKLKPGDEIELRFRLKNRFDDDYREGDIEGDIKVVLDDSDFGDDFDEEESYSLDAGDRITDNDDEYVFSFTIPLDAKEGTYTLEIELDGTDDNGADYEEKWDLDLKVERDRDDLRVNSAGFTPQVLSCLRDSVLNVEIINFGRDRQKHAVIAIEQTELGINVQKNFDIAKGASDDNTEKFTFPLQIGKSVKVKEYDFTINVFYDLDKLTDRKFTKLKVSTCQTSAAVAQIVTETAPVQVSNTVVDEPTVTTESNAVTSAAIVKTVEEAPYTSADVMVGAIIIAMVLMLAVIMLLLIVLLKR